MFDKTSLFSIVPESEDVETPWGPVRVRAMTAGEKDRWDIAHVEAKGVGFRARLVVACAFNDAGPIFSEADVPALSALPHMALEPVVDAAIRVNRLQPENSEALRKN